MVTSNSPPAPIISDNDADEAFVNVWFGKEGEHAGATRKEDKSFYSDWVNTASAKHSNPSTTGADALYRLYPNHSLVMTAHFALNILNFPEVSATPIEKTPLITNLVFIPLARSISPLPGILIDQVQFGGFHVSWKNYEFKLFIVQYPQGYGTITQSFILHEGPEDPARALLLSAGAFSDELHDQIWVFNQGFWQKDHGLWQEVQKADWKDVILKDEFKKALQKDIYGFFASEEIYKQLAIPWKRGLIMYGPPGNGKTISLKTIMKTCSAEGFAPLYVKSFQSYKGEEGAMADVFDKARQTSPCVIILEDLDSLINDKNRSFFLNQLDGLDGNNGLLVIGTTNHFERLDPGISTRPSRFDRKFKFDDPNRDERILYVQYWQNKLKNNKDIDFPDRLVSEIADLTDRFSFAYLKEVFVSSLVTLLNDESKDKPSFAVVLKEQIAILRNQLDKSVLRTSKSVTQLAPEGYMMSVADQYHHQHQAGSAPPRPPRPNPQSERDVRALLDALSDGAPRVGPRLPRVYDVENQLQARSRSGDGDIRALLDALSDSLANTGIQASKVFDTFISDDRRDNAYEGVDEQGRNFRALLDRINSQRDRDNLGDRIYHSLPQSAPPAEWSGAVPMSLERPLAHPHPTGPLSEAAIDLA